MTKEMLYHDIEFKLLDIVKATYEENIAFSYLDGGRSFCILQYVLAGKRAYEINNTKLEIEKGAVVFIPAKTEYKAQFKTSEEKNTAIAIAFRFEGLPENLIKKEIYYKYKDIRYEDENIFVLLERLYNTAPAPMVKIKSLLYYLIEKLADDAALCPVQGAIDYISEHYCENLPVKTYADTCNLSESHFRKLFRQYTGVSPIEYRNKIRFRHAMRLHEQNLTLNEIAEKLGFFDASYFCKMYKRYLKENDKEMLKFM